MLQYLVIIPSAVFCYLPMRHQLRCPLKKLVPMLALTGLILLPLSAFLQLRLGLSALVILLSELILLFPLFRKTVKADLSRCLTVFLNAIALLVFIADYGFLFDARLHPDSGYAYLSWEAGMFQLGCALLLHGLLFYPVRRYFASIIDRLQSPRVWHTVLTIPCVFIFICLYLLPLRYQTLYVGRIFSIYLVAVSVSLLLYMFLCVLFYHITNILLRHSELEQKSKLLVMQANQYQSLLRHMEQQKQLRHDFRHSIHVLSTFAEKGDLENLKQYLREYDLRLNSAEFTVFCTNPALNALFNYYHDLALSAGIQTQWQLSFPEELTVSELDLVSLLGNMMENAVAGCLTLPKERRYFSLSTEVRHGALYIVSTNSFDGKVCRDHNGYLSTKRSGMGTGLLSIAAVAEKYHGMTHVSNSDTEFFVDVMLRLSQS